MKNIITLIVSLLVFNFGYGQEIASFSSVANTLCSGTISTDPNITATGICRGSGIIAGTGGTYNSRNWTLAGVIDSTDYLEWTLTPNAGYQVDLTTMDLRYDRSNTGPTMTDIQVDTGSGFSSVFTDMAVAANSENNNGIDLSTLTALTGTITFRLYAYNATSAAGTFDIEEHTATAKGIIVNGSVAAICTSPTVTWDGANWTPSIPDINTPAIINANYITGNSVNEVSFSACSLTVSIGFTLTVNNGDFVEIENSVVANGTIRVETQGAFVQNDAAGTFIGNGIVLKTTPNKQAWYYYTYWSSPVEDETAFGAFPDTDADRRFWFNASNYLDENTVGTTNGIPDDIDDNGDDWQIVAGGTTLTPGVGYAATAGPFHIPGASDSADFNGAFNTGDIDTSISFNVLNTLGSWNFIGNPYPSAIDFIAFHAANSTIIDGAAYFWSQWSPPDATNPGNEVSNFSQNDYATYTVGTGGAAGASGVIPTQYVPSGQGFFVVGIANGTVTFNNAMRSTGNNTQFFRAADSNLDNKLWVNLTSDNGVFSGILVGYVEGATNNNDGLYYDAPRNLSAGAASVLYTTIENSNKKFVIQGKDVNSLTENEVIKVGFKTTIDVATLYTLSIAQFEGDFFSNNTVYLKDNLLNILHDLSLNDYTFTSEVGEFNDRFEIVFNPEALSLGNPEINNNDLSIIELNNGNVQFKLSSSLELKSIEIFDLLGRTLYRLKANGNSKTYNLSNLSQATYIAKVELSNGVVITKKAVKRF